MRFYRARRKSNYSSLLARLFRRIYEIYYAAPASPNATMIIPVLESLEPGLDSSAAAACCPKTALEAVRLLQWKFDTLFGFSRNKTVSGDDSHARIPAQDRVIMARRANGFGFFEASHRLA